MDVDMFGVSSSFGFRGSVDLNARLLIKVNGPCRMGESHSDVLVRLAILSHIGYRAELYRVEKSLSSYETRCGREALRCGREAESARQ